MLYIGRYRDCFVWRCGHELHDVLNERLPVLEDLRDNEIDYSRDNEVDEMTHVVQSDRINERR
eukprot:scaffold3204_cov185-Alexandrium_tamarense.AAC.8